MQGLLSISLILRARYDEVAYNAIMTHGLRDKQFGISALFGLVTFACVIGGLSRYADSPSPFGELSLVGMSLACVCIFVATFFRCIVKTNS